MDFNLFAVAIHCGEVWQAPKADQISWQKAIATVNLGDTFYRANTYNLIRNQNYLALKADQKIQWFLKALKQTAQIQKI